MDSFELAVRDLETLVHKTADGKAFTKELEECRKQLNDQRKRQAEELKAAKVQEVTSERPGFKKVAISEDSDDSDDKEEVKKLKATKKTK